MDASPANTACALVIFGGAGDLTKRLLMPAIYNLKRAGLLPENFALVGVARTDMNTDTFREALGQGLDKFGVNVDPAGRDWLVERMHYLQGAFDDPATYKKLKALLEKTAASQHTGGNALFYLATPAASFGPIIEELGKAGLADEADAIWRRVIIEKPFGSDLESAKALNRQILAVLDESQVYRIDHYLGKETVQNIMVFRFANGLFEPVWNRDHIDHVQITVAETVGVGTRGKFYDATGALRDMVPNHVGQLITMIAMEPPVHLDADSVRTEKAKALQSVQHYNPDDILENVVRAQYTAGTVGGQEIVRFRSTPNVDPESTTETYVAMKLKIDNWRWAGVPFYIRTGKALAKRHTEIAIQFKRAPFSLFRDTEVDRLSANNLVLHIQPEEGMTLRFGAKKPGPTVQIGQVEMKFNYGDYFQAQPATGYETLIYDCMKGDASLFQRADSIEAGWAIVQPIMDAWKKAGKVRLPSYEAGSAGPSEAVAMMERDGRRWRPIDGGLAETAR
jgi:glucose-6-phosphate 1-dehydrogenase